MKTSLILLLLIASSSIVGCNQQSAMSQGFALPPGDIEEGQLAFIDFRCIECHTFAATEFVGDDWQYNQPRDINVVIGGEVAKVKSYGDLVTSIINPSHRIAKGYDMANVMDVDGESNMKVYNDVMTVAELVDLVTFLQSEYQLVSPPLVKYPYYGRP